MNGRSDGCKKFEMEHSMTIASLIVLFLAVPLLTLHGQERDRPLARARQVLIHVRKEITKPVEVRHPLYLPRGYEVDTTKRWLLLLFLHGSGERGDDFELVKRHGPPKLIELGHMFEFIVISPQCPELEDWSTNVLNALLDEVIATHRVDVERIYLTGLSMGGWGVWNLALAVPDRFAAIAPVCGRMHRDNPRRACLIKHLPVWVFHGGKDEVVPISDSEKMVTALKQRGGNVQFTVYSNAGHDAWTETYNNPELYRWLLSQRRRQPE